MKSKKRGNQKKIGNWKKQEIEKVGNQKRQEIGKSRKSETVGNQKKQEMKKVLCWKKQEIIFF